MNSGEEAEAEADAVELEEDEAEAAAVKLEEAEAEGILSAFNLADVDPDPDTRNQIEEYATSEIRDKMRRAYLSKGVRRLYGHDFSRSHFGKDWRNFKEAWYKDYSSFSCLEEPSRSVTSTTPCSQHS